MYRSLECLSFPPLLPPPAFPLCFVLFFPLSWYGVATISRLLKIIGLFCKRALQKRPFSAKETYTFKEPTNRSHPIHMRMIHPVDLTCHPLCAKNAQAQKCIIMYFTHDIFYAWCIFPPAFRPLLFQPVFPHIFPFLGAHVQDSSKWPVHHNCETSRVP